MNPRNRNTGCVRSILSAMSGFINFNSFDVKKALALAAMRIWACPRKTGRVLFVVLYSIDLHHATGSSLFSSCLPLGSCFCSVEIGLAHEVSCFSLLLFFANLNGKASLNIDHLGQRASPGLHLRSGFHAPTARFNMLVLKAPKQASVSWSIVRRLLLLSLWEPCPLIAVLFKHWLGPCFPLLDGERNMLFGLPEKGLPCSLLLEAIFL